MQSSRAHHRRQPLVITAAVLASLVALASCSQGPTEDGSDSGGESSKAVKRYYDQELSFGSCADYASNVDEEKLFVDPFECARLEVPLSYAQPDGKTAQVAVLRVPATGPAEDKVGSLLLNSGGPGGAGLAQAVITSIKHQGTPVTEVFDIVGFDPRGVGRTTPTIECHTDAERDAGQDQVTLLASSGAWSADDTSSLVDQCAQRSGGSDVLASVGTRDTARDMDVLRAVLGEEKLTYAGQSYGTRLGAVYAEMFPDKVRALVLDGAADPSQDGATRRLSQQKAFQRSFDQMARTCAQQTDCALGTDPTRASAEFQQLVRPLIDDPAPAAEGRTLNFNQATGAVTAGLYDAKNWPAIIAGITQLKEQGRGDMLLTIYDGFSGRTADGKWRNYIDANFAINCNDELRRTPEEESDLRAKIIQMTPFVDPGTDVGGVTRDACEAWPTKPTLKFPYAQDVKGLPQTLTISITGDPSTPYEAGKVLAESLGGTMLTVEGERHTVALDGINPCVNAIFADYLATLKVPGPHQRCTL